MIHTDDEFPDEDYTFDFAISFAGPQRPIAEKLASLLSDYGAIVFYDSTYKASLLGRRLDREFEWLFGPGTSFFVPLISRDYVERNWPQLEWSVALGEAPHRRYEFILPLRVDDSRLLGLHPTVAYLDLREHTVEQAALILMEKLEDWRGRIGYGAWYQTWIATFGLQIADVLESPELPEDAPEMLPDLYDWLESDLIHRLSLPALDNPRYVEPSQRTGETLSVRVGFEWMVTGVPLSFGDLAWWHLLDLALPPDDLD